MGSNRLIAKEKSKEVEFTSLSQLFDEKCPIFMSYGMSYDEYWHGDSYRAKYYLQAHKIKVRQKDEEMWMQGMYIYEALCDVSPILHAFSKTGTKPLQYSNTPYLSKAKDLQTKEEKKQEKKNAQLMARVYFENWARNTKKHFDNMNK